MGLLRITDLHDKSSIAASGTVFLAANRYNDPRRFQLTGISDAVLLVWPSASLNMVSNPEQGSLFSPLF